MISSPITASRATDKPPSVCNEPSVVLVAAVVSSVLIIPLATIVDVVTAAAAVEPDISTLPLMSINVLLILFHRLH